MSAFIVAEVSANHRGDKEWAKKLISKAKECGADAVKLQTYRADSITLEHNSPLFKTSPGTQWSGRTMYDLYSEAATPWVWHEELKEYADGLGIELFSSPFDYDAVDLLASIGIQKYKIASPEAMDYPLISYAAKQGKPMIISTGMVSLDEIQGAVDACHNVSNHDVTLLKCTSRYPAPLESLNLLTISDMLERFRPQGVRIGLSDHSMYVEPAVAAVALGVTVIEKHLTLGREYGGVDSEFSLNPSEFSEMVKAVRNTEVALGAVHYVSGDTRQRGARSLFVTRDVRKGERFTSFNVRSIRPSHGLHPKYYPEILKSFAVRDIGYGTPLSWDDVQKLDV